MKTYTWLSGGLTPGVELGPDRVLVLGTTGRESRTEKVNLCANLPPIVTQVGDERRVIEASFTLFDVRSQYDGRLRRHVRLSRAQEEDEELALVRITCFDGRSPHSWGHLDSVVGAPKHLTCGIGGCQKTGLWQDALALLHRGDVVKVTTTTGRAFGVWLQDTLFTRPWDQCPRSVLSPPRGRPLTEEELRSALGGTSKPRR